MNNNVATVNSGRLAFVDPLTLVYVPNRATVADGRQALRDVYTAGLLRPRPEPPGGSERVYPLDYCPTDSPDRWFVPMRNDGGEWLEVELHVLYRGNRDCTFHSASEELAYIIDVFTRERSRVKFDGTYPKPQA